MLRMATTTTGHLKVRSAFRTQGHGVVRTRSEDKVAAVSAREIRKAALRSPCAVTDRKPSVAIELPGVRKIAGIAIVPVKNRAGNQTHAINRPRRMRDSSANNTAITKIEPITRSS